MPFRRGPVQPFKDVHANGFCASLLRMQIRTPRHASMRALSHKMNNDRADDRCYSFALVQRFWTFDDSYFSLHGFFSPPIFYVWFSTIFYVWCSTFEENLSIRSLNFLQNAPSNFVLFRLRLSMRRFQMLSWRFKFCESVGNAWNYLRNGPSSTKYD